MKFSFSCNLWGPHDTGSAGVCHTELWIRDGQLWFMDFIPEFLFKCFFCCRARQWEEWKYPEIVEKQCGSAPRWFHKQSGWIKNVGKNQMCLGFQRQSVAYLPTRKKTLLLGLKLELYTTEGGVRWRGVHEQTWTMNFTSKWEFPNRKHKWNIPRGKLK